MAKITLGISGSIAIQKIPQIIQLLQSKGHELFVIMTASAMMFDETEQIVTAVGLDHFWGPQIEREEGASITHIDLAQKSDLFLLVPSTYNSVNKYAHGIADDMLSTVVAASDIPVILCPAMNTVMYENIILQQSLLVLQQKQWLIVPPIVGQLACGVYGIGHLADVSQILDQVTDVINTKNTHNLSLPLKNKSVVITAGATKVYIDPIRYISNTSTGKMGIALAQVAKLLGANVILITGEVHETIPQGICHIRVDTPEEMLASILEYYSHADYVFMSAAVSDYRPQEQLSHKIKKQGDHLELKLERSVDILHHLGQKKEQQILIGFAAEDRDHLAYGAQKLATKNLDYIIVNDISNFQKATNEVTILDRYNGTKQIAYASKLAISKEIFNYILEDTHEVIG